MALISLLIKAFFLYIFFSFLIGAWRLFRSFKILKGQANQGQFGGQGYQSSGGQGPFSQTSEPESGPNVGGDVFEAEYRVVKEDNA